jgi:nitronate monooxygenase
LVSAQAENTAERWPSDRVLKLLGINLPIIQAPMAGATTSAMAIPVAQADALGSLPCATLALNDVRAEFEAIRSRPSKPINLNFFCHADAGRDLAHEDAWQRRLKSYYLELGLDPELPAAELSITPFGSAHCDLVVDLKPEIVSFHLVFPARISSAG